LGWHPEIVWECEIKRQLDDVVSRIASLIHDGSAP
jgi:G:T-mismatch repair DNA endonuclease (very short patch repair protein)